MIKKTTQHEANKYGNIASKLENEDPVREWVGESFGFSLGGDGGIDGGSGGGSLGLGNGLLLPGDFGGGGDDGGVGSGFFVFLSSSSQKSLAFF